MLKRTWIVPIAASFALRIQIFATPAGPD